MHSKLISVCVYKSGCHWHVFFLWFFWYGRLPPAGLAGGSCPCSYVDAARAIYLLWHQAMVQCVGPRTAECMGQTTAGGQKLVIFLQAH